MLPQYIDNLCRLGLAEVPPLRRLAEEFRYDRIKSLDVVTDTEKKIPTNGTFEFIQTMVGLTVLGATFRKACVTTP